MSYFKMMWFNGLHEESKNRLHHWRCSKNFFNPKPKFKLVFSLSTKKFSTTRLENGWQQPRGKKRRENKTC